MTSKTARKATIDHSTSQSMEMSRNRTAAGRTRGLRIEGFQDTDVQPGPVLQAHMSAVLQQITALSQALESQTTFVHPTLARYSLTQLDAPCQALSGAVNSLSKSIPEKATHVELEQARAIISANTRLSIATTQVSFALVGLRDAVSGFGASEAVVEQRDDPALSGSLNAVLNRLRTDMQVCLKTCAQLEDSGAPHCINLANCQTANHRAI